MLLLIAGICIYDQAAVFYIAKWDEIFMPYFKEMQLLTTDTTSMIISDLVRCLIKKCFLLLLFKNG
jgi:hypothetical protein